MYELELNKAVNKIKKNKAKLVLIQIPDGLKPNAELIKKELESKTDADVLIWMGSCFGSCDVPENVKKLGVELIIQWGHSEWK
ncbi:MAG: diphthamide synthesis protein [Nanoarchaeota archaeon]|nr:diphthamide synthesis protein [Nanoarchaeota archaeon]